MLVRWVLVRQALLCRSFCRLVVAHVHPPPSPTPPPPAAARRRLQSSDNKHGQSTVRCVVGPSAFVSCSRPPPRCRPRPIVSQAPFRSCIMFGADYNFADLDGPLPVALKNADELQRQFFARFEAQHGRPPLLKNLMLNWDLPTSAAAIGAFLDSKFVSSTAAEHFGAAPGEAPLVITGDMCETRSQECQSSSVLRNPSVFQVCTRSWNVCKRRSRVALNSRRPPLPSRCWKMWSASTLPARRW